MRLALQRASYPRREDVLQHQSHRHRVGVHELHEEGVEAREMPAHERRGVAGWRGGGLQRGCTRTAPRSGQRVVSVELTLIPMSAPRALSSSTKRLEA